MELTAEAAETSHLVGHELNFALLLQAVVESGLKRLVGHAALGLEQLLG